MRIFLAVFPPPETQTLAFDAAESLQRAAEREGIPAGEVAWVRRENLHYTLSFLGELNEEGAARAEEAAREAAIGLAPFEVALGAPGAFPNARRARVLWLGLSAGADPLIELAVRLERALRSRGFSRDERPFSPHLTVGRVRDPRHDLTGALAGANSLASEAASRFTVRRVSVVASTLSPGGSRYEIRAEAALGV